MTQYVTTFPLPWKRPDAQIPPSGVSQRPAPHLEFTLAVDEEGRLTTTAFGGVEALLKRSPLDHVVKDDSRTAPARRQIEAFFRGEQTTFTLTLAPRGSVFQQRVWHALQLIPFGQTRSYGDLARELGSAPRAVGRANATNPICLVIPCHRVIGADGSLTGFAFGEEVKRQLLEHEAQLRFPKLQSAWGVEVGS